MWPYTLSGRLPVIGLVGFYPANYLMGRSHLPKRFNSFPPWGTSRITPNFLRLFTSLGQLTTCYAPVRHYTVIHCIVRLACLRHAASVRSEPGSNSPLYESLSIFKVSFTKTLLFLIKILLVCLPNYLTCKDPFFLAVSLKKRTLNIPNLSLFRKIYFSIFFRFSTKSFVFFLIFIFFSCG